MTHVETKTPLELGITPDELIIKERYALFLDKTQLHEANPDIDLTISVVGNYRVLEKRKTIHQHWLEGKWSQPVSFPEAAADWYETLYRPANGTAI